MLFNIAQKLKEAGCNVKAMATLLTPWGGSLLLKKRDEVIALLDNPLMKDFIGNIKESDLKPFKEGGQGLDDIAPGSPFLQGLHNMLKKNTIPVLAIGAHCGMKHSALSPIMERLIGQAQHDSLISLDSQLANNITKSNFTTYTIKNVHHGWCPTIADKDCLPARKSTVCLDRIREFILYHLQ